jgi:cyclopropane fatty-acyl-phospholipid synthase-like methyltransferase
MTSKKVVDYYNETQIDYKILWNSSKSLALHFGFWEDGVKTFSQAVQRENEILAELANIKKGDKVLDAGCGVGGSSIFLARKYGAKVTGITIVENQVESAIMNSKNHGVEDLTEFYEMDFCNMKFKNNSFDVTWGIESICHAQNKKDFLREAKRILKKGGRLVVADGFLQRENLNAKEEEEMKKWLDGWAVPNLATVNEFRNYLTELGFKNIQFRDIKENVMPSSVRLYRASILGYPVGKILEWLGLRTKIQTGNILSAFYQYRTLKKNLWTYGIFYAENR